MPPQTNAKGGVRFDRNSGVFRDFPGITDFRGVRCLEFAPLRPVNKIACVSPPRQACRMFESLEFATATLPPEPAVVYERFATRNVPIVARSELAAWMVAAVS